VIAIGPVSHPELFARCAMIVHHGGAGTTANAARSGAPQLVVPHLMDQFYWGERVIRLGLGAVLRRQQLRTDRLVAVLGAILDNEVLSERAREVGERLRCEAASVDAVAALLDSQ
jgi:UDP:flavonoid glycosyltransferase YjiC (YdhE family)